MTHSSLHRDEKTGIIYRRWECPSPKAVFLLVHGLGAFSGRWDPFADFFLKDQISSYAIELKGFGETEGLKGHIDSFDIYIDDIRHLHDIITREHSGKKIFLVGESMGALVSFFVAGLAPDLFDGIICISAALKSRLKFSAAGYLKILFLMMFDPRRQLEMPFDSAMCTRDADYRKVMDADEREHRLATPRLLLNIVLAGMRARALRDRVKAPVLFLIAGDFDALTDPDEVKRFFKGLHTRDKEIIQYPEMYHSLSVESGREKVFGDILAWVRKRT